MKQKLQCPLCGHMTEEELINHINEKHEEGLHLFLSLFGQVPIVDDELYSSIYQQVKSSQFDDSDGITAMDKVFLVQAVEERKPERSKIFTMKEEEKDVCPF